jgi:hypothetical protein
LELPDRMSMSCSSQRTSASPRALFKTTSSRSLKLTSTNARERSISRVALVVHLACIHASVSASLS